MTMTDLIEELANMRTNNKVSRGQLMEVLSRLGCLEAAYRINNMVMLGDPLLCLDRYSINQMDKIKKELKK
jgi:hypothetical protein